MLKLICMKTQIFKKNDDNFVCAHCQKVVKKLGYSSRNHCPFCLHSLHLDINPGDRASNCGGLLKPVGIEIKGQKGYVINFVCEKCKAKKNNISAKDDSVKKIIEIASSQNKV